MFRLVGLVAITITFVVFHQALAALQDLHGAAAFADLLLHTVVPVLAVSGWLVAGPHGLATRRTAAASVLFPACWVAFTLVRGALITFYPYSFVDVHVLGYARVAGSVAVIGLLLFVVAVATVHVDGRLTRLSRERLRRAAAG